MIRHHYTLIAFVYMPEHVHLIVQPAGKSTVSQLLYAIKRPFSHRVQQELLRTGDPILARMTAAERPGGASFRFWQAGPGYDRNITTLGTLRAAIEYVHDNPVRRQLCPGPADWKWSSCRYYFDSESWGNSELPTVSRLVE